MYHKAVSAKLYDDAKPGKVNDNAKPDKVNDDAKTIVVEIDVGEAYTLLYGNKEGFDKIHNAFVPCVTSSAPSEKWMYLPEMDNLIESAYDIMYIDLTRYGFSETCFPLRSRPPQDPFGRIICIGYLRSLHFVQVYLKPGCHIAATSVEWTTHFSKEAETWPNHFLKRMEEFIKLTELEREINREKSKKDLKVMWSTFR
ncbi:uncharacterized protein LOC131605966 [Vicia villosa]|uniref:uncharacterized protein LOC131605966 n=1 Tax=Vicia villosa TaxID=3911 RepID=UPI00273CB62F|nr:uncharacterized protein LOC131605966 [Vicia villosa]